MKNSSFLILLKSHNFIKKNSTLISKCRKTWNDHDPHTTCLWTQSQQKNIQCFQHPLDISLERCVTTQSILWHYIEPITSSIDIVSIAFKCSLGKKPTEMVLSQLIEKLFLFSALCLTIKTLSIFSLLQFNLFYWVIKKNHRIFIWPEAYFYNLISNDAQTNSWKLFGQ